MPQKTILFDRKKGLYLKNTGVKGHGVFCVNVIKAGEVLEVTPSIVLNEAATGHTDKTILLNYTFTPGEVSRHVRKRARIKKTEHACVVIMGITSFCNHTDNPNAEVLWEERKGKIYYTLQAIRPIPKNTEICTTYGDGWFDDRKI